jgi:hypothetical protein
MASGLLSGNAIPFPGPHTLLDNRNATASSFEPSLTDQATYWLANSLFGGGREGVRSAQKVTNLLEMLPVTGDITAAMDARHAFQNDRNLEGGLLTAGIGLGAIPLVGPAIRKGLGSVARSPSMSLVPEQKKVLTPELWEKLAVASDNNPKFAAASKFMHPAELVPILNSRNGVAQTERLLEVLPTAANVEATAKFGAPKQGWYRASTQALIDVFGKKDAPRFAALLAATSPQNSVEMNLLNTLNIWKNWTAAGRPQDAAQIKAIMGDSVAGDKGEDSVLDAWVNNSNRALTAKDPTQITLSGPKVDSFYRNLTDDVNRVTNDAWMSNFSGISQDNLRTSPSAAQLAAGNPGMTPTYAALSARVRQGGARAGMSGSEGQETIWSTAKPLMEMQSATGKPARQLLEEGLITPEVIRETPDFSTLLNTGTNREILKRAGYENQLDAMVPYKWPDEMPSLSLGEQNEVMKTAARIEDLGALRGRESAAKQFVVPGRGDRAFVSHTAEAVPGAGMGHLPSLLEASSGARDQFTSKVRAALTDAQGMDIINKNLGFPTLGTRVMQGAYRASPEHPIEFNPGYAAPVEVPLTKTGKIPSKMEQKLRASAALRGTMTAQHGTPYSGMLADKKGKDLLVPTEKKLDREAVQKYVAKYGLEDAAIADYGRGAGLLNWTDKPYSAESAKEIGGLFGTIKTDKKGVVTGIPVSGRNVVDPDMSYFDIQAEWLQSPGSGAVTNKMMAELDKLGSAGFKRLDQKNIRQAAGDLEQIFRSKAKKGEPVREDLMNLLQIVKDKGLAGLRKAVKAKEFLPSLAAIGLAPTIYRMSQPADQQSDG